MQSCHFQWSLREVLKFNVSERKEERKGHYNDELHVLSFLKTIHKKWN